MSGGCLLGRHEEGTLRMAFSCDCARQVGREVGGRWSVGVAHDSFKEKGLDLFAAIPDAPSM